MRKARWDITFCQRGDRVTTDPLFRIHAYATSIFGEKRSVRPSTIKEREPVETLEALTTRRSCRAYTDKPVDQETIDKIVEAGRYAANGMNRQPVTFVEVTDPAIVAKLSHMNAAIMGSDADPFYGAKSLVVVLVDTAAPTCIEDGALAMGNMLNAAHALGVDSCWIHRAKEEFESDEGKELLTSWGLPADGSLRGIGHCILGYAAGPAPEAKPRTSKVIRS